MPHKKGTSRPGACAKCGASNLERRITTYPVRLTGPEKLAGKEIQVGRVALYACLRCGYLMPTPAGQAKVDRCVGRVLEFLLAPPR
ncbi:MAG TPA: hypothetical protein VKB77_14550 [Terriglobales bacterium]|nr:hypothetical protein [Terriglobales bacterium]HKF23339.1 hypothetical protein [Candidatus Angelobacter sp.]